MKRFGEIYKQKVNEAEIRQESKVLDDFKLVYSAMLEHYDLKNIHQLDDEAQISFLTELNNYWSEEKGISEKGISFVNKRDMHLNENSTSIQRKNYLKNRTYAVINETIRQTELKYKLYDVIDEMYKQVKASDLSDVLSPETIVNIITESLETSTAKFLEGISKELKGSTKKSKLSESAESKKKYYVRIKAKK